MRDCARSREGSDAQSRSRCVSRDTHDDDVMMMMTHDDDVMMMTHDDARWYCVMMRKVVRDACHAKVARW